MSVFKRGKKWYYDFPANITPSGRRERGVILTARTKAMAEEAERQFLKEIHDGTFGRAKGMVTLRQFYNETYLPWAKATKRSWKDDTSRIKPILELYGDKRLKDISAFDGESLKVKRRNAPITYKNKKGEVTGTKPRAIASVNRELMLLSAVLTLAVAKKEIAANPLRGVKPLEGEVGRERYLLPDEEERLMPHLTGKRAHLHAMVVLAINSGLREEELFSLEVQDVDFHRDAIHVRKSKNGEDRFVPMNDTSRRVLRELVDQATRDASLLIFTNPNTGKKYTSVKNAWATACRLAEITNLHWHDLRHTFGTRAVDGGANLRDVQKVMGHKSIKTTEGYAHATEDGKRRAVAAVENASHRLVTRRETVTLLKAVND
jgi:integrase